MISSIHIDNAATYSNITIEPKQINFVYGGNGTGKTTLSRVISGTSSGSYHIEWENGTNLETLVFNGEFVEKNFSERISGIFTLGEDDDKTARRIEELGKDIDDLDDEITTKSNSVTGQREKQQEAFLQFAEACWIQRKTFSRFSEILKGTLKGKDTFAKSCLAKAAEVAQVLPAGLAVGEELVADLGGGELRVDRGPHLPVPLELPEVLHVEARPGGAGRLAGGLGASRRAVTRALQGRGEAQGHAARSDVARQPGDARRPLDQDLAALVPEVARHSRPPLVTAAPAAPHPRGARRAFPARHASRRV